MPSALRRVGWRIGAVLAMVTLTLTLPSAPACACSCVRMSQAQALAAADVAFVGVVTAVHTPMFSTSSADQVTVDFEVESVSKGDPGARKTLRTDLGGASCGYEFTAGNRYQVYSNDGQVSLCSGTTDLGAAPEVPLDHSWSTARKVLTGAGVASVLLAAAALTVIIRRRRQTRQGRPTPAE